MPEYGKLKKILEDRDLLKDEIDMWLRLGMYITREGSSGSVNSVPAKAGLIIDAAGNERMIHDTMASNLRQTIILWWETEKKNPRANEPRIKVGQNSLDQLENRNGS